MLAQCTPALTHLGFGAEVQLGCPGQAAFKTTHGIKPLPPLPQLPQVIILRGVQALGPLVHVRG